MEYFDEIYKEREGIRKELLKYLNTNPVHIKKMAEDIGVCYPHIQRWMKDPNYVMGRIGLIKVKQFLNAQKGS